ncbi:MAG: GAF domain-containing protein, partial [Gammaproteobacteria bacterium]
MPDTNIANHPQKSLFSSLLLLLLTLVITISDFSIGLALEFTLKQTLHVIVILVAVVAVAAHRYIHFSRPWSDVFTTTVYLLVFSLWSYELYLLQEQGNIIVVAGLVMVSIWYGVQTRWFIWVSLTSTIVLLVVLKLLTAVNMNYFAAYVLFLMAGLALSVFVQHFGQSQRTALRKSSPEFIESSAVFEEEIPQPLSEPDLKPDVAMIHVELGESSKDWEHILRELHNELKATADVDQLFKRLLVFMSGALEFEAAMVGMIQERTINKIAAYGPEYMTHAKVRAWNSESIKRIFKTQESVVNQQEHLGEDGKPIILYRIDIPVITNGKATGVVTIMRSTMLFNDYEISLASSMVFHAMVALRQARLQEEIKRLSTSTANRTLFTREQFIEKANLELDQLNKPRALSLLVIEIDKYDA